MVNQKPLARKKKTPNNMLRNPKLVKPSKGFIKQSIISIISCYFTHVCCMMVPPHNSSHHLFPNHLLPHLLPSSPLPSSLFPSPSPLGSGTGQLPAVWSLPFVVGTSIPQRTLRSCSMTLLPWWTATHLSSAWKRPGASCPSLSSPSSTIFTGKHAANSVGR